MRLAIIHLYEYLHCIVCYLCTSDSKMATIFAQRKWSYIVSIGMSIQNQAKRKLYDHRVEYIISKKRLNLLDQCVTLYLTACSTTNTLLETKIIHIEIKGIEEIKFRSLIT